jgi:hypothetical protein
MVFVKEKLELPVNLIYKSNQGRIFRRIQSEGFNGFDEGID